MTKEEALDQAHITINAISDAALLIWKPSSISDALLKKVFNTKEDKQLTSDPRFFALAIFSSIRMLLNYDVAKENKKFIDEYSDLGAYVCFKFREQLLIKEMLSKAADLLDFVEDSTLHRGQLNKFGMYVEKSARTKWRR